MPHCTRWFKCIKPSGNIYKFFSSSRKASSKADLTKRKLSDSTARKIILPDIKKLRFSSQDSSEETKDRNMGDIFVIGVSGVTCGGKTSLTKLLEKSFPMCRTLHQDTYFYDDDSPNHVRIPELSNHANYELLSAINMKKMHEDIQNLLSLNKESFNGDRSLCADTAPNFKEGWEALKSLSIDMDLTDYCDIPVLIIEGFVIFESKFIFDSCDVRIFMSLDEDECLSRRSRRQYEPPDIPQYFEKCVWPAYVNHYENFIHRRHGIKEMNGKMQLNMIWKEALEIIICRMNERFPGKRKFNSSTTSV